MAWELEEAIHYSKRQGAPKDQTALVGLLREIQHEHGGIPQWLLPELARELDTKESYLLAVIRRIPGLHLAQQYILELCGGPNCRKSAALAAYAEELRRKYGEKLTVKFVPCMRMCGKGPNIRFNGELHHKATKALLDSLTAICQS